MQYVLPSGLVRIRLAGLVRCASDGISTKAGRSKPMQSDRTVPGTGMAVAVSSCVVPRSDIRGAAVTEGIVGNDVLVADGAGKVGVENIVGDAIV